MAHKLLRYDYLKDGSKCICCQKALQEGYVAINASGFNYYFGRVCAKAVFKYELNMLATLPDLTARKAIGTNPTLPAEHTGGKSTSAPAKATEKITESQDYRYASQYLWLRLGRIPKLTKNVSPRLLWEPLVPKFKLLEAGKTLNEKDVVMILHTERDAPDALKCTNLLDIYEALLQFKKELKKADITDKRAEFIKSLVEQVSTRLFLTKAQIEAAGIKLNKSAFDWAIKP